PPRAGGQRRRSSARTPQSGIDIAMQHQMRQTGPTLQIAETPMPAVAITKPPQAVRKDLYEIGEVPPLGHVPARMHAWAIRKERHGPPETSMQRGVLRSCAISADEERRHMIGGGEVQH